MGGGLTAGGKAYRIVLSVRRRIQWGTGRFCFIFLARMRFVLKVLRDGYKSVSIILRGREREGKDGRHPRG